MKEKIKKMLPNMITLSRIISLVVGFILFTTGREILAIYFYVYGSVSDAFDGYFARKFDAYTKLGSYLDAISDKFYALSIIIISVMNKNYLIISVALLELVISIISYTVVRKNGISYTERVGKFKMTLEFILLIVSLLSIKIRNLYYLFILLLVVTLYFQIQSINAYINQKNGIENGIKIEYKGKSNIEKAKLLLKEFTYYLLHPVKIAK